MNSSIPRFMLAFFAVGGAFILFLLVWWFFVQRPKDDCEGNGNWWDPQARVCGHVVFIPDITGRYHVDGRVDRQVAPIPGRPAPARPLPQS